MNRLSRGFFARPVLEVAADLLGRHVRHAGVTVRLTETEAYAGLSDPASRVLSRPTRHNAPVFGPPGHAFVYFTYGHHWMLCVVTGGRTSPRSSCCGMARWWPAYPWRLWIDGDPTVSTYGPGAARRGGDARHAGPRASRWNGRGGIRQAVTRWAGCPPMARGHRYP